MSLERTHQDLPYSPVSRATIQEHVYARLRDLIVSGGIEPGRTVTVSSLSEAFGVSAMPVREALHRLVAEKALTVVAGRSVGIPPLTAERLEDLRRVRSEVEGTATQWATQLMSPADLSHLSELIAQMDAARLERDRARYMPANRDFHFTVYRAAGSEALLGIIGSLWLQIGPYFNLLKATDDWWSSNRHHKAMHKALARKDGVAARDALQADIDGAATALLGLLATEVSRGSRRGRRGG
ncbi:DNA-binding transcriptional regulator, GntR family [Bosea sp. OK403]|jgi:DNA-binding GntR family transcriptional regulator|uniref:GntR family transcriptional regulator n=1 Tax=Bosea sp. OK403 TaxID=1855286 RepID=UPI0008EC3E28|nr:GntR family transcriptional regulator [Bosea sp. OK403]SFJ74066.1 DNA-binding transcriptional regulator, GntR family [Bosea sp. OK403]